jgi:hypothetical protein
MVNCLLMCLFLFYLAASAAENTYYTIRYGMMNSEESERKWV